MSDEQTLGFHRDLRPLSFDEVVGQEQVVTYLKHQIEINAVAHAMIFSGPSGTGKTTVARIMKSNLNVSDLDYVELNAADMRGIDTIREIASKMPQLPLGGDARLYVIDEAHQLTTQAQQAMLKMLEDTPKHVYFILITSEPTKLIKAVHTRCTSLAFKPVEDSAMMGFLKRVLMKAKPAVTTGLKELCAAIVERAGGSPRMALVLLEAALAYTDPKERIESVVSLESIEGGRTLAQACYYQNWKDAQKALQMLDKSGELQENFEGIRRSVLGYAAKCLLTSADMSTCHRAAKVAYHFADDVYASGKAGIILATYMCCNEE